MMNAPTQPQQDRASDAPAEPGLERRPATPAEDHSGARLVARRAIGQIALTFCRNGREHCSVSHCRFAPFCACAREDMQALHRAENRIWRAFAVCGGLVILLAFGWALRR